MASAQWLLNDTSVAGGSYWTAESGSSYKLKNISGASSSRITSSPTPYEGAGCYRIPTDGNNLYEITDSSNNSLTGNTYYFDSYVYTRSSPADDILLLITGDNIDFEYSWVLIKNDGTLEIKTYDTVNETLVRTASSSGACPDNEWFRVQVKVTAAGITETRLFKGAGINGTSPDTTLTFSAGYGTFDILYGGSNNGSTVAAAVDDIKFDNTAYPTRGGTAHTASGTSTITATATASMSNARVGAGSGTGTATGTGAASRGQSVTGSASVTASATAAMSSTQVIGASGTGTASGTATGSTSSPSVVTISGSATITGTGTSTASVAMAQTATATGTVIATSSVDFIVTPPITLQSNGTVIADSSGEMAKTMPIESTGTATATSQADATHTYYIFKPPTREISPLSLDPYYELVGYFQGRTLVKRDGVWKLVQNRQEDWLDQCEYVFKGGCENRVTGAEKAELESAGYTVETRTS